MFDGDPSEFEDDTGNQQHDAGDRRAFESRLRNKPQNESAGDHQERARGATELPMPDHWHLAPLRMAHTVNRAALGLDVRGSHNPL